MPLPDSASREWNSSAYHRLSQPQFGWGRKLLERIAVRGDETVLDIGCGTGRLTAELLERLPHGRVIAVDLSRNMLEKARDHLLPRFGGRVAFIEADMQALPFEQIADGVFSAAAFHWAPDHDRLFQGLFRALKPGGWIEAQCGGGPNLERIRHRVKAIIARPEFAPHFAAWANPWEYADPETTTGRMRRAGFVAVKTWLESSPAHLSGAEDFKEYLATVTLHRHLERLPTPELRDRFLSELAERAAEDDPPFVMDYWRLNITGKKPG